MYFFVLKLPSPVRVVFDIYKAAGVGGAYALAWVCYIVFAFSVSLVRQGAREKLNIAGWLIVIIKDGSSFTSY